MNHKASSIRSSSKNLDRDLLESLISEKSFDNFPKVVKMSNKKGKKKERLREQREV